MNVDFIERSGLGAGFLYKTESNGFFFNGTAFTEIVDADYPKKTVRGLVYLDGTYYVMTPEGAIYGSNINDPVNWSALNVIQSQSEPDTAVALARQLNLVVSFGQYSTEFFYNAANPIGSPLLPYTSAFLEIGCASAGSIVNADNNIIFMSVGRQRGRSIQVLDGTVPRQISTPFIDRILNADNLKNVVSYYISIQGHGFYVLTLPSSKITLVCDVKRGEWTEWTQLTLNKNPIGVLSASWANGVVTLQYDPSVLEDGDIIILQNMVPSAYNGKYVVSVTNNVATFSLPTNPGTATVLGTILKYEESYFNMSSYSKSQAFDLVQDSTTGAIYALNTNTYLDNDNPIKYSFQTTNVDGGNNLLKFYSRLELIGDKTIGTSYLRYSDDDYQTWNKFRPLEMKNKRSQLYRLGSARRRAFNLINYEDSPVRLESIELSVEKGFT